MPDRSLPYGASPAAARAEPPSDWKWPTWRFSRAAFSAGSSTTWARQRSWTAAYRLVGTPCSGGVPGSACQGPGTNA